VTLLVIGGIGFATCFSGFLYAWKSGALEKAAAEAQAAEAALEHQHPGDAPHPGDFPHPDDVPPPSLRDMFAPGCYAIVLEFESSREENGQYGDWEVSEERSRAPVPCNTVRAKAPSTEEQELLAHWPPEATVLRMQTLSTIPRTPGNASTRRKVVLIHARVDSTP
jgi:hypothetical protein